MNASNSSSRRLSLPANTTPRAWRFNSEPASDRRPDSSMIETGPEAPRTIRIASASTLTMSSRSSARGSIVPIKPCHTFGSVRRNVVRSTRSPSGASRASFLARWSATTVLPVPGPPRTRAGPLKSARTIARWDGCRYTIHSSMVPSSSRRICPSLSVATTSVSLSRAITRRANSSS
jgi:hypothetical protein